MINLRRANANDSADLSSLILLSAPLLLPYLFSGERETLDYLFKSAQLKDGQYSAQRHQLAYKAQQAVGCITLWDTLLPQSFHDYTLKSLKDFLTPAQISHVLSTNEHIRRVFAAPREHQICIGHLAVRTEHRGFGIGKKLIAYAIRQAKSKNRRQLILDVDNDNNEALSFYANLGFTSVERADLALTGQSFHRMHYNLL